MSRIGSKALELLEVVNLKINSANLKKVVTADGKKQAAGGLLDLPINFTIVLFLEVFLVKIFS